MFKRPTVFVLGAGASHPYGFPLGSGLRDIVIAPERGYPERERAFWRHPGQLARELGMEKQYRAFTEKLRLSAYASVDQFLEKNSAFTDVGRLAIAAALIPRERPPLLFPPLAPRRDHWFEVFANMLHVGDRKFLRNRVTIITYNYDRSLRNYLWNVMAARLPSTSSVRRKHFYHLPIIHLHGQLGMLGALVDAKHGTLPYGTPLDAEAVQVAMREITVIHAANPTTHEFIAARQALREAERIYFLGFGYNPTNLDRLQVFRNSWSAKRKAKCIVRGTSVGLSERDWHATCANTLGGAMPLKPRYRQGITAFLRNVVDVD
jgi:hypothetical protein